VLALARSPVLLLFLIHDCFVCFGKTMYFVGGLRSRARACPLHSSVGDSRRRTAAASVLLFLFFLRLIGLHSAQRLRMPVVVHRLL